MGFDNRNYHFYLIFGKNILGKEPWLEEEWINNFEPLFSKIIGISPYKKDTGIRVLEYVKENESDKYYKEYKLGKIGLDKKSIEKWVIKKDDKKHFSHFASWTPRWTICDKINKAPDVYLAISNENYIGNKRILQFDTLVTIAIAEDFEKIQKDLMIKLSKNFYSKRTVYIKKSWFNGKVDENNKWDLEDWIDCIGSGNGIYKDTKKFKSLDMHIIDFNKIEFEPYWEIIY